jgi:hypothetical protein
MIQKLHDRAFSGDINPLEAYAQAKHILDGYTKLVEDLKEYAQDEAEKYPKQFEDFGFKFEKRSGRTLYDFKHLIQWQQADNNKKLVEQQSKAALEAMRLGNTIIDADGCIVEPPKISYTKDSLIIKKL